MDSVSYTIRENEIRFANGISIAFRYPIGHALAFDDVVVVQLEIPFDTIYNENVFGIDSSGRLLWQIRPFYPKTEDGAFGGLDRHGDLVVASNYRGLAVFLNPRTGEVRDQMEQIH